MTRGIFVVFLPNGRYLRSIEFNGDMYYEGLGKDAISRLQLCYDIESFKEIINRFNADFFKYDKEEFLNGLSVEIYEEYEKYSREEMLDCSENYFRKWSSDYVYFQNLTKETLEFKTRDGEKVYLAPGCVGVLNFGRMLKNDVEENKFRKTKEEAEKYVIDTETIKKLAELEHGLRMGTVNPDDWINDSENNVYIKKSDLINMLETKYYTAMRYDDLMALVEKLPTVERLNGN